MAGRGLARFRAWICAAADPRGTLCGVHDDELVRRVAGSLGIRDGEARRVVGEVIAFYQESTETFVRRRHAACRTRGMSNAEIFPLLIEELATRVVAPPALSERQVRRIIYG